MEREHLTGGGTCRLGRLIGNCIPVVGFWQCVADQWLSSQLAMSSRRGSSLYSHGHSVHNVVFFALDRCESTERVLHSAYTLVCSILDLPMKEAMVIGIYLFKIFRWLIEVLSGKGKNLFLAVINYFFWMQFTHISED